MPRGLDHLVIAVHGLDRARHVYEQLGFTLTPTARHPFGTENSLVQLESCFLELLAVADPDAFPGPEPGAFNFPAFNAGFLESHEGMSMLVLDSADAAADRMAFAEAGLQTYLPFEFGRDAQQPDGSTARVGFRLAFVSDPLIPEAAFFACQQLAPQFFWKPEFQSHANTGQTISEVIMIADKPSDHRAFFEAFAGARSTRATGSSLSVETARGSISIQAPHAIEAAWGDAVPVDDYRTPRFAAFVVGVADLSAARNCLEMARIPHETRAGRLVVPSSKTMGAAIAFEALQA